MIRKPRFSVAAVRVCGVITALALLAGVSQAVASSSGIVLRGIDSQNLAPFKLSQNSTLSWSCSQCAGQNFIVSTDEDDPVNALGPTHGTSYLSAGKYTDVSITATGPWTIHVA